MAKTSKPPYLISVFTNKCPRCRKGKLFINDNPYRFKGNLKMNPHCLECNQPTEIEVGFYYGTGYVSYALTVAICVATFIGWWVIMGFSIYNNSIYYWLAFNAIVLIAMQPLLMRLSRSLWLSWFVKYNPNWEAEKVEDTQFERIIPDQMDH